MLFVCLVAISQHLTTEVNGASTAAAATDCSALKTCTECVTAQGGCDWCTAAYKCTNNVADTCKNDILVSNGAKTKANLRGADSCPKITAIGGVNEILVPSGTKQFIKAKIQVTGHFLLQKRFQCKFTIDGQEILTNAQLLGETFTCDQVELTTRLPQTTAKFEIIYEKTKTFANPNNMHLLVYNCREMGNTCKTCFTLPAKFNCGWCKTTSKCDIANQCSGDKINWLSRQQTCP